MPDSGAPLRAIVAGAGNMGRKWLTTVVAQPGVDPVGLVDPDRERATATAVAADVPELPIAATLSALLAEVEADILVDAAVPEAHYALTRDALIAGLAVVGEKPAAETVGQALASAALSEAAGRPFMVSQSRRLDPRVDALRSAAVAAGPTATLTTSFARAPRFGGFREEMEEPLLVDMAIHPFDTARYVLGAEPVSVYCESFNPAWSWYAGAANASAIFRMSDGSRYVYTGSWCAPGRETSWNGRWRADGARGTAEWDGEGPATLTGDGSTEQLDVAVGPAGITAALAVFLDACRSGLRPRGMIHENVLSLAMVEAAVESARSGARVDIDAVLERGRQSAVDLLRRDAGGALGGMAAGDIAARDVAARAAAAIDQAAGDLRGFLGAG